LLPSITVPGYMTRIHRGSCTKPEYHYAFVVSSENWDGPVSGELLITKYSNFIGYIIIQVTLPTFILEKRSLLEMYADFFAHPDLFVK